MHWSCLFVDGLLWKNPAHKLSLQTHSIPIFYAIDVFLSKVALHEVTVVPVGLVIINVRSCSLSASFGVEDVVALNITLNWYNWTTTRHHLCPPQNRFCMLVIIIFILICLLEYNYLLLLSLHSLEHKDTYLCEEAIYCISADPTNDSVFIAASHEGKALVYDIRTADGEWVLVLFWNCNPKARPTIDVFKVLMSKNVQCQINKSS